jgi:hypothetical protein
MFKEVVSSISFVTLPLNHYRSLMLINEKRTPRLMSLSDEPTWIKYGQKNSIVA